MNITTTTQALAAVGVREPVQLIEASATPIAVSRIGRGQPVVCLHATGHGGGDFQAFSERVLQEFEVITIDWPGQGRSPPDQAGRTASAARYAEILAALLPKLVPAGSKPILLGNSIGGAAALILALEQPHLIRALVLANPGGLAPLNLTARIAIAALVAVFKAGARKAWWFPAFFSLYYRLVLPSPNARPRRTLIVAQGRDIAAVLTEAWSSFRLPEADLRGASRKLKVPVLFTWAAADRIVAWKLSRPAVSAIPGAQVQFFEGGHCAFLEDPDHFASAFRAFADSLGAVAYSEFP